jgi:hypothetical protein
MQSRIAVEVDTMGATHRASLMTPLCVLAASGERMQRRETVILETVSSSFNIIHDCFERRRFPMNRINGIMEEEEVAVVDEEGESTQYTGTHKDRGS